LQVVCDLRQPCCLLRGSGPSGAAERAGERDRFVTDGGDISRVLSGAGAAQHNRPLPLLDLRHRAEGEHTPPRSEETAAADDDLVGVVSVPLVADVAKPAQVRAVAREHPVAAGGGKEPAEFRLRPLAPLVLSTLPHGREE
jgi:hypothetical protein